MSKNKSKTEKAVPPPQPTEPVDLVSGISEQPAEAEPSDTFQFQGTLMDGPSINLVAFAGLELTAEEREQLWQNTNPRDLLLECECVDEIEDDDGEYDDEDDDAGDQPGQSDRYYTYEVPSKEHLAAELKQVILGKIKRQS